MFSIIGTEEPPYKAANWSKIFSAAAPREACILLTPSFDCVLIGVWAV